MCSVIFFFVFLSPTLNVNSKICVLVLLLWMTFS